MSLLQDPRNDTVDEDRTVTNRSDRPLHADDGGTVDLTRDHVEAGEGRATDAHDEADQHPEAHDERPVHGPVEVHGPVQIDPSGRVPWRGMRIRRVRLLSVAKLSFIFWVLAFAVLLGTTVAVWTAARAFGFIGEIETTVVTALGIDAFEIDGGALFRIAAAAVAFLTMLGWVMTILLAAVYNASCAVFGGLAVETGPLKRRKRVFSLRHRGFVTIRS
ncbi:MAG TPA: DUF3566 domain-containing protein [Acidimicrobiales bacterium]|nr:DUF3566 domain-containing protein [Acidimicrobiales bacterium]